VYPLLGYKTMEFGGEVHIQLLHYILSHPRRLHSSQNNISITLLEAWP